MRRSLPGRTTISHRSFAWRVAQSILATSFDDPSAEIACFFVRARGRMPWNETRTVGVVVVMFSR